MIHGVVTDAPTAAGGDRAEAGGCVSRRFYSVEEAVQTSLTSCCVARYPLSMSTCSCNDVCVSHGGDTNLSFLDGETARMVAETMQALATPSRVRILSRLTAGPCSVGELTADVGMAQSAVSQQLRVLRSLGLVVGERDGRNVIYSPHDDHVGVLLAEAVSHTEHLRLGLTSGAATPAISA